MPEPGMLSVHPCPVCDSPDQTCTGEIVPGRVTKVLDYDEATDRYVTRSYLDHGVEVPGGE